MKTIEQRRTYFRVRYAKRKAEATRILGGCCKVCGTTENLELDHINPSSKEYEFHHLFNLCDFKFQQELKKCQLLCDPCHNKKSKLEKTQLFCLRGHPRVPENLNGKACRICAREHTRKYKAFHRLGQVLEGPPKEWK